jgi:Zn-dependent protease with chaperone function
MQWATAFDGRLPPIRATLAFRLWTGLVFVAMLLLPLVYIGLIVAAAAGVYWYAVNATGLFTVVPAGRISLLIGIVYLTPLLAGVLLILFMILPVFWRPKKRAGHLWVDRKEQPLLFAYVDKLCDTMGAPRPLRIDLTAAANASARIDNGLLGLVNRRLVLSIGLPFAAAMDLRQFTGVLAHELGHFTQGGSMRASYAIARINGYFFRLAYAPSGVDQAVTSVLMTHTHWAISLMAGICKLVLWAARLLLKLIAIVSHAISMQCSRHAEYDADRHAARIVGSEPAAEALQLTPFIDAGSMVALKQANANWKKRALPDDLVFMTNYHQNRLPEALKNKMTSQLLALDTRWFDTHPPLFQRAGALKKLQQSGVLRIDAPATCLFRNYDELCKMTTINLYQSSLGEKLQAEHLYPVEQFIRPATPAKQRVEETIDM